MSVIKRITETPTDCLSRKKSDSIPAKEIAELMRAVQPFTQQGGRNDEQK